MARKILFYAVAAWLAASGAVAAVEFPVSALVESFRGDVRFQKAQDPDWVEARTGQELRAGDKVRVGDASEVVLTLGKNEQVKLGAFSNLIVDRISKNPATGGRTTALSLDKGTIYARAVKMRGPDSTFSVKTPTAVAAVRGTRFKVISDESGGTVVETLTGSVAVTNPVGGGAVEVGAGQKTTVAVGKNPTVPVPITREEKESWTKDAASLLRPSLDLISPLGDQTVNRDALEVAGITDPGNTVSVAGKPVEADAAGNFKTTVTLTEGENRLEAIAMSPNGQAVSAVRKVIYDKAAPEAPQVTASETSTPDETGERTTGTGVSLFVGSPLNGSFVRDGEIVVSAIASGADRAAVNGSDIPIGPGGTINATMSLLDGENRIVIEAAGAGGTAFKELTVTLDNQPPMLVVTQPASTFRVAGNNGCRYLSSDEVECEVQGFTEPGSTLTVNGRLIELEPDGSFLADVMLDGRSTQIWIASEDRAGNRKTVSLARDAESNDPAQIFLSASKSTLVSDGEDAAELTATVTDFFGRPVEGVEVSFTMDDQSAVETTNSFGQATVVYDAGFGLQSQKVFTAIAVVSLAVSESVRIGGVSDALVLTVNPDAPPQQ